MPVSERRNALGMYPVVELDENTAPRPGRLLERADRRAGGESGPDTVDSMAAAIADAFDDPVLTGDVDHFEPLGVDVETYCGG